MTKLVPIERIENIIFTIRGYKVLLDTHLADLLWCRDSGTYPSR